MYKLFSRISLFCLLSLAYPAHVVAFDDDNCDLFGFPKCEQTDSYDEGSGVGVFLGDDNYDGYIHQDKNDSFKSSPKMLYSSIKKDGADNSTEDTVPFDSTFPKVPKHELGNTDPNMFIRWWQESTSGQIWGLAGMVAILGYGMHQLYVWYKKCDETLPAITESDYEVAKTLLEAMHDDMKQLKDGSKKLPKVNLVDLSKMTPEFAEECQILVTVFMNMYKACREDAKNVVMLETFYSNVADAMYDLEERVEQTSVKEHTSTTE